MFAELLQENFRVRIEKFCVLVLCCVDYGQRKTHGYKFQENDSSDRLAYALNFFIKISIAGMNSIKISTLNDIFSVVY